MEYCVVSWTGTFEQSYRPSYRQWNENEQGWGQLSSRCL